MGIFSYAFGNPKPKVQKVKTVTWHQPVGSLPKVKRKNHTHVQPSSKSLIDVRGWKRKSRNQWVGYYVCNKGTFAGKIIRRGDIFDVHIKHPPIEVKKHSRFICFARLPKNGWFSIHLHQQPIDMDPSSVIFYVEKLLNQALKRG